MPLFMDRHFVEGSTWRTLETAHEKDMALQDEYGVRMVTYWFDEDRHTAFCLAEADSKEALVGLHQHAHGDIPSEVVEVEPQAVAAFLGVVSGPDGGQTGAAQPEPGFRAIMFTDLLDFTALTSRLGDAAAMGLLRTYNALMRQALAAHGGREVKHTGDGIMASFASVSGALRAAADIQRAFADQAAHAPQGQAMTVRIGLAAGEPIEEDGDLFGASVQLASRLCALAAPAQVLAAESVREAAGDGEPTLSDMGLHTVKGFAQPVRVYALA
jgi:class 3 adenylate cyclase